MGKYRMIALDMDGTLLNEDKEISPGNFQALQEAAACGITVVLATGRRIQTVIPYAEQLGLNTPVVTANGGEIWETPQRLLHRNPLDARFIGELRAIALEHQVWYWGYTTEEMYNQEQWAEDNEAHTWLKFGYYSEQPERLVPMRAALRRLEPLEITNSALNNLEVNAPGASKASALERLCRMRGFDMSELAAMGDSLNDLAMIRAAGLGVAMGNAQQEVKQAADVITLTNEQDGVAHAIRSYVL